MSETAQVPKIPNSNSAGSAASGKRELDSHYLLARAEYDACIASVGIQPGWRVLDAGCGTGTFLPHIARLVGRSGSVVALDHAADSIDIVRDWVRHERPAAAIETHAGPLHRLPFPDASFDCIWNANVLTYLSDSEYHQAMVEFERVLKPGGLLAIKEMDYRMLNVHPLDPALFSRLGMAISAQGGSRTSRVPAVGMQMRAHGLRVMSSVSTLIERTAPFASEWIPYMANQQRTWVAYSKALDLPAADHAAWADIDANIETLLANPDARYREVFMLFVGQKPGITPKKIL